MPSHTFHVMVRWCISIFLKSPGAYDHIRNSGFLMMPSRKTLNKYINFTDAMGGLNPDVLQQLETTVLNNTKVAEKHVGIVIDEMKIKQGLVFNKHSGKIVGFLDLGKSFKSARSDGIF